MTPPPPEDPGPAPGPAPRPPLLRPPPLLGLALPALLLLALQLELLQLLPLRRPAPGRAGGGAGRGLAWLLPVPGREGPARKRRACALRAEGAGEGLGVLIKIVPAMVALLTAVYMLRASGLLEALGQLLAPLLTKV